ncbi:hypothetical protein B7P43_G13502 [Cryptotermes secundus]|uniref:Gustatory receptor n=1 Tax=Cryptotermes secundus TaxID=105785 RepID=A0A2J7PYT9_9NEOP|nr:hypothetical protein B7P43_G13502 [Cryptotermes secundus]
MEFSSTTEEIFIPLKPLFLITRIFALTNAQSFNAKDNEENKIQFQNFALVGLWIAAFLVGMFYTVYVFSYGIHSFPNKVNVALIADILLIFSTSIVTLVKFSVNSRNFSDILRKLRNIDWLIKCESRMEIYKETRRGVVIQLVTLSLVIFLSIFVEANAYVEDILPSMGSHIPELLSYSLNIITVLMYANITRMAKYRYMHIFELLQKYCKAVDMKTFNKTNRSESTSRGDIELPFMGRSSIHLFQDQSKHLQTLRLLYIEMYDTVQMITSHFGVPILCHILSVMVTCVLMFYSSFHFIHDAVSNSEGVTTYIASCYLMFYGIVYVTPFVWLVISCDETAQDANRGVIHIQRAIASPYTGHDVITELEKLSNQLKDMKVEFSVCGLFVLNLPFLCTFVGGIFTYIIIMVQLN